MNSSEPLPQPINLLRQNPQRMLGMLATPPSIPVKLSLLLNGAVGAILAVPSSATCLAGAEKDYQRGLVDQPWPTH